ncbi:MAG: hypothetical protein P4L81_02735 [Candidatus Pacebacteria bacterium]|nr:hypothetical protein [Candidatus Paceibacterota bacterium]
MFFLHSDKPAVENETIAMNRVLAYAELPVSGNVKSPKLGVVPQFEIGGFKFSEWSTMMS